LNNGDPVNRIEKSNKKSTEKPYNSDHPEFVCLLIIIEVLVGEVKSDKDHHGKEKAGIVKDILEISDQKIIAWRAQPATDIATFQLT
jgi:hypothetical protein